jgi:hypothetical protein
MELSCRLQTHIPPWSYLQTHRPSSPPGWQSYLFQMVPMRSATPYISAGFKVSARIASARERPASSAFFKAFFKSAALLYAFRIESANRTPAFASNPGTLGALSRIENSRKLETSAWVSVAWLLRPFQSDDQRNVRLLQQIDSFIGFMQTIKYVRLFQFRRKSQHALNLLRFHRRQQ